MMKKAVLILALFLGGITLVPQSAFAIESVMVPEKGSEPATEQAILTAADRWETTPAVLWQEYEDGILTIQATETGIKLTRQIAGGGLMILILDNAGF